MFTKNLILISFLVPLAINSAESSQAARPYSVKILIGDALKEVIPFIATERIIVFSEYPYLYAGNFTEEMSDLTELAQHPDSTCAIAYYGETPIGLLTGCPLPQVPYFKEPISIFNEENTTPDDCYYFAEIIILPEHRGKKLSTQLFDTLEEHAKKLGYKRGSFITESHEHHPLKPKTYKSLEPLWIDKLHYKKTPIKLHSNWRTYQTDGSAQQQEHTLNFWIKNFNTR